MGGQWAAGKAWDMPGSFGHVIAPTYSDVQQVCFEGESGILNKVPHELIADYNKSDLIITWINGSIIRGFSAEKPSRLRGPQAHYLWCDELAAWQYIQETWDMAMMGLRLGPAPQVLWTTTPKPKELIRRLSKPQDKRIIVRGSTFDNKANLPDSFFKQLEQYEGTTLGRQELYGELIDPEESGIVKRSDFRLWPAKRPLPPLDYIILSLDTAFTEKTYDKKKGDPDGFYAAKILTGRYFIRAELPRVDALAAECARTALEILEMPAEAW